MKTNILHNIINNVRVYAIMMVCLTVLGVGNAWGDATTIYTNAGATGTSSGVTAAGNVNNGNGNPAPSWGNTSSSNRTFITLTGLNVSGYTDVQLTFDYKLAKSGSSYSSFTVSQYNSSDVLIGSATNVTGTNYTSFSSKTINIASNCVKIVFYGSPAASTYGNYVDNISITGTLAPADPYTVTFNPQGGTCGTASLTEASGGAGVTLPAASPTAACASEGWAFYGWATARCASSTSTAPTIVGKAGDTYHPLADNTTLHAVYATGEYTKITSTGAITSGGKYIIAGEYSGDNYVMTNTTTTDAYGTWLVGTVISEDPTNKYHAAKINAAWLCTITATSDKYYIQNASGGWIDTYYADGDWYNYTPQDTYDKYTIDFSAGDGTCTINNSYGTKSYLTLFTDGTFGPNDDGYALYLYKQTTTPAYWSNPSCCDKEVAVSYNSAGSTHVSAMTFSAASIATCGGASTRQVTVSVTPTSGYLFKAGDVLTWTKSSGTIPAAPTLVSGPTLNAGKYEFVYEFAQNDNGTGTFAATASTLTNYRTTCCTELGSISGTVTWNGSDPTEAEVSWNNIANVSSWTVKYKTHAAGAYTTWAGDQTVYTKSTSDDSRKVTITGLTACTDYDFQIIATPASGYCDKDETIEDSQTHNYTVTSTGVTNVTPSSDFPTTTCTGFSITSMTAADGYHLPTSITVTNADKTWNSSTGALTISNVTGNVTITITAELDACDDYSFFYGTSKGFENNFECFSFVTGSTDTWLTDLWTIPSADQWTYVGEPNWDPSPGKSANLQLSNMPYALNHANNLGTIGTNRMEGAQGYIKICSNSTDANRYVGFIPAGYVFRWGTDGSGWNSIAFTGKTSDIEEEDWNTPLQTWTSSNADDYTYVGLKTSSGYVWANRSETRRPVFLKPTSAWDHSNAYFAIYYFDASSHTGWSAIMTDPDGDGIYEAWIPNDYTYTTVNFVRLSTDATGWGNKWNQTGNLTLPSDKNVFTITGGAGDAYTGEWSLYDKKGTFHISANSNTNNWYCHFLPHNVLSYDKNTGSGDDMAVQSVAINAASKNVAVADNSYTAPTGHHFDHWNTADDDGGTDYAPSDTYSLTADATLYAIWAPNTHSVNYSTPSNGNYTISVAGGSATSATKNADYGQTVTLAATPNTGYEFTSWTVTGGTSGDEITVSNNQFTMPDEDVTVVASFTIIDYNVIYSAPTNGSYTISVAGGAASSETKTANYGQTITLAATPASAGYQFSSWTVTGATSGSTIPVTNNEFSMPAENVTVTATFSAKTITVTWNPNNASATVEPTSSEYTYNGSSLEMPTPIYAHHHFDGWYTASGAGYGTLIDNVGGSNKPTADVTYYAHWSWNQTTLIVADVDDATITATPAGSDAIGEGSSASVVYNTWVTLSYTGLTSGLILVWDVYKTGDMSTKVSVGADNRFRMPDEYDVIVSVKMYKNPVAWCDPQVEVSDGFCLTSYYIEGDPSATNCVYTTSAAGNLLTINSTDLGSVDKIEFSYLDGSDNTVTLTSSPFRLCNDGSSNYNVADGGAGSSYTKTGLSNTCDLSYSIRYKPTAYNLMDNYKLKMVFKKGTEVRKTIIREMNGRSLPEEFVIAAKFNGQWYALPNTLKGTQAEQGAITPIKITVDNTTTPTAATYAPTTTVYKGRAKYETSNPSSMALTSTGSNYLQTSNSVNQMWLSSSGYTGAVDWYFKSSDRSVYELAMDPVNTPTKKMGIDGGHMGYYGTPTVSAIYLLPITNKYTDIPATATEWGQHSVILAANPGATATKAQARIEAGTPTEDQTISGINGAIGTAKNVKVPVGDIDLADLANNEGKLLYIDWFAGSTPLGTSAVTIPRIIAADRNMKTVGEPLKNAWTDKEVHVLPGFTLTANTSDYATNPGTATIKELHIYPGATLKVSTGTLTATTLRLHNGWTRAGEKQYNTARVYISDDAALVKTTASMDYDIYELSDGKHYYPLAVPFQTAVNTIDYVDETLATASVYGKHFAIKEYDGANRAANGEDSDNNWDVVESGNLVPGKGYIMTAVAVKGEAILRVPLTFDNGWTGDGEKGTYSAVTKNVIEVTAYDGAAATGHPRHKGWNMLGVPFMSCYGAGKDMYAAGTLIDGELVVNTSADQNMEYDGDEIPYVSVPSHDFAEYIQTDITEAELRPGWSFFVQVNTTGDLTFAVSNQQADDDGNPIYAPRRSQADEVLRTGIILSGADASDKTTILVSDRYNGAEYEIGADLEKMFGNGYTLATYSLSGETRLAYNAMSKTEAQGMMPIGFRAPEDGEYTFSLNPRYADAPFERVDLIDYQTGELTNLLTSSYTFATERAQNDTRFALNVVMKKDTPTDIETVGGEMPEVNGVRKLLINDKLYIIRGGQMYDATGKRVMEINK